MITIKVVRIAVILLILTPIVSCQSTPAYEPLPCPLRPILQSISIPEQERMGSDVVSKVAQNQIALKKQILLLENLAGCTDTQ